MQISICLTEFWRISLNFLSRKTKLKTGILASIIGILTALLYAKVSGYDFIILDDNQYIIVNTHVRQGLSWDSVGWAFTSLSRSNWHPLTWISHMLDVSLFGLEPGYHHLVNVFFHAVSTALLFVALFRMTGTVWKSAFVAALFGVHPLHVESVAWVAERKDVLSGFFFMLILLAYTRYARRRGTWNYITVLVLFAFGLMAKPMLVSVPLLLLMLDVWPLGRTNIAKPVDGSDWTFISWRRLCLEKAPLVVLAFLSSVITIIAQQRTISTLELVPASMRISNALNSYVAYLWKMLWPSSLAVYYPYPTAVMPLWKTLGALIMLLIITIVVLRQLRQRPFLFVGWFCYIIMLLPVIGIIQVGGQAMADRYTYLPLIGPFVMIIWLGTEKIPESFKRTSGIAMIAFLILVCLSAVTFLQISYWRNSVSLFTHAVTVTEENAGGYKGLGIALSRAGRNEEAVLQLRKALTLKYDDAETHKNLGFVFAEMGRVDDAIFHFNEALKITPDDRLITSSLQILFIAERKSAGLRGK